MKRLVMTGDGAMPYVKAARAIEISGLPPATFHRLAASGKIRRYYPTNASSRAMYDEEEMKQLRRQHKSQEEYIFDWLTVSDLGSLYDLEINIYGEDTGDPNIVRTWLKRNPLLAKAIFNKEDRHDLWGVLLMLPIVDEETMIQLCSHKIRDVDLNPSLQILSYQENGVYNLYVASVIMKPDKKHLLVDLIRDYLNWWVELAPEKCIGKIWGRVVSPEGELLAIRMQASPLDWFLPEKVYRLDLDIPRRLPLIRNFQQKVAAKEKA